MKILMISSSAPFGKGESFVISEVSAIARAGHHVILLPTIIRKGMPNDFELSEGVELLSKKLLSISVIISFLKFLISHPFTFLKIIIWVRDKNIKNTLKNFLIIPKALWLANRLRIDPVEHIHAHWLTTPSTLAMVVSWLTGIAWSMSAHRGDIVMNNLLNEKFEEAEFIRFISENGVALARERAEFSNDKVRVLHLGVTVPEFVDRDSSRKNTSTKKLKILCPANLIPVKGHSFLFKSLSIMKHWENVVVVIAGDGELKKSLTHDIERLGLAAQVTFEGHVPHSKLLNWYREGLVDLVVLPSQDLGGGIHEGIPVSLMEAMAFGVPVVSTNTGGIPELLLGKDGEAFGGLVDSTDPAGLAHVLDEFVGSEDLRREMAQAGYWRVFEEFNQDKTVDRLVELMINTDKAMHKEDLASD